MSVKVENILLLLAKICVYLKLHEFRLTLMTSPCSSLTLHMFIACRGIPVLVSFLEPDYAKYRLVVVCGLSESVIH